MDFHTHYSKSQVRKMAREDALEAGRADMAYGQGAGTRRKIVYARIQSRMSIPGYVEEYEHAFGQLDFAQLSDEAVKEAKRKGHKEVLGRNARALVKGDVRNMSTPLSVGIIVVSVAHASGYDKVVWEKAKGKYQVVKVKARRWNDRRRGVHNIKG